jgi:SAM-dependent methyltransferase
MTGLDFSSAALNQARLLSERAGPHVEFVEAELYDAVAVLGKEAFDLVFTGIGALCWLPSIVRWANVVADLLVPGGRLFIREGHPMLWTLDDERAGAELVVEYPYFERAEAMVFDDPGTYVTTAATFTHNVTHEWNHGLGEIVTALLNAGMEIRVLEEHDSVPWEALPGKMSKTEAGEWRLADRPWRLPHSYTLQAIKRSG